jgi:sigma-E factor negative regulatory protein RseC
MIEARVRVVSAANGTAWVSSSESSGCSACQSQSSCGISGLGKYLSRRRPDLPIRQLDAKAGDELLVCVDESELLRASLFAYLLPALLAVIGAAVADAGGASDLVAALAALLAFISGLAVARFLAPTPHIQSHPVFPATSPSNPRSTS